MDSDAPINRRWPGKYKLRAQIWAPNGKKSYTTEFDLSRDQVNALELTLSSLMMEPDTESLVVEAPLFVESVEER